MYEKVFAVPLQFIVEPEKPVRSFMDDEKFQELVESIKENGVIEPIICQDLGDKLEIVAGHRRFMASKAAGKNDIPAIVQKFSPENKEKIKLHENYGREDLSQIDEAFFFQNYMTSHNITHIELADKIKKNRQYVERRLLICTFHKELLKAVREDWVSISAALTLNKIDNEQELLRVIDYAKYNGCSSRTADLWVRQWESSKAAINLEQKAETSSEESGPTGKILWTCFICDALKNATETFTVPLCPECRTHILKEKEARENATGEQQ